MHAYIHTCIHTRMCISVCLRICLVIASCCVGVRRCFMDVNLQLG